MNCLIRIRQRYAGFAQSDKKLADFLLSQPDRARHLSSQQLASEAGVSQSSVVKFAQKIGFKGGSEYGVINFSVIGKTQKGHKVCAVFTANGNEPQPESKLAILFTGILQAVDSMNH